MRIPLVNHPHRLPPELLPLRRLFRRRLDLVDDLRRRIRKEKQPRASARGHPGMVLVPGVYRRRVDFEPVEQAAILIRVPRPARHIQIHHTGTLEQLANRRPLHAMRRHPAVDQVAVELLPALDFLVHVVGRIRLVVALAVDQPPRVVAHLDHHRRRVRYQYVCLVQAAIQNPHHHVTVGPRVQGPPSVPCDKPQGANRHPYHARRLLRRVVDHPPLGHGGRRLAVFPQARYLVNLLAPHLQVERQPRPRLESWVVRPDPAQPRLVVALDLRVGVLVVELQLLLRADDEVRRAGNVHRVPRHGAPVRLLAVPQVHFQRPGSARVHWPVLKAVPAQGEDRRGVVAHRPGPVFPRQQQVPLDLLVGV